MPPPGGPPAALHVGREALSGRGMKSLVPDRGAAGVRPILAERPEVAEVGKAVSSGGGATCLPLISADRP